MTNSLDMEMHKVEELAKERESICQKWRVQNSAKGLPDDEDGGVAAATDLTLVVGGHASHVVVHCGKHRDRLTSHIHSSKDHGGLRDT